MENLMELVAASFARHGIECPAADSPSVWGRTTSPIQLVPGSAPSRSTEPISPTALPEHNYRKTLEKICP
jgi:hypothetical protein